MRPLGSHKRLPQICTDTQPDALMLLRKAQVLRLRVRQPGASRCFRPCYRYPSLRPELVFDVMFEVELSNLGHLGLEDVHAMLACIFVRHRRRHRA